LSELTVNGEALVLNADGALYWPDERLLVFSDLHFEKGSFFATRGRMLPPYDTHATLARVSSLIVRYAPSHVIALGDSFHDEDAPARLASSQRDMLLALGNATTWIWITGNHDPRPPAWLGGRVAEEIAIGGLVFRHEPSAEPFAGEIAGHLHPCKCVTRRGRTLRRRCFVSDGARLVMPAFGAYAGGLDVRDGAVRSLFADEFRAYVLGANRVYAVAA